MRWNSLCLAALLLTVPTAARQLSAQREDSVQTATLAGLVRDSTGAPIAAATLVLGARRRGTQTDAQGWFTLPGVPPGAYTVRVERLGYAWVEFRWVAQAGERTEVAITLPAAPRLLDSMIVEGKAPRHVAGHATVLGLVLDSAGAPLAGANVQVLGSGRMEATGDDGAFYFPDLAPGSYVLRVRRLGFRPRTVQVTLGSEGRHTLAIRMRALGSLLDTVEVRGASGFGNDQSAWRDFDARMQWRSASMRSITVFGDELRSLGKTPLDIALQHFPRAAILGVVPGLPGAPSSIPTQLPASSDGGVGVGQPIHIVDEQSSCILVNGSEPMYAPLREFHSDELQAVEVYAASGGLGKPESELTGSVFSKLSVFPACGRPGSHPPWFVVWLKGAK